MTHHPAELVGHLVDRHLMAEQREVVSQNPERFLQELGLFLRSRFEDAPV